MIISGRSSVANRLAKYLAGKGYGIITVSPSSDFRCFAAGCPSLILVDCQDNCNFITEYLRLSSGIPVICLASRACTASLNGLEHIHMDELLTKVDQIEALVIRIQYRLKNKNERFSVNPGHCFVEYHKDDCLSPSSSLSLVPAVTALTVVKKDKMITSASSGYKGCGGVDDGSITLLIVSERKDLSWSLIPQLTGKPNINFAGDCIARPERFSDCLEQLQPNLLLLDTISSHLPMAQWLRMIREKAPTIKIILLCDNFLFNWANEIVEFGVSGCLLIEAQTQMVIKAIRAVSEGELWLPRSVLVQVFKEMLSRHGSPGNGSDIESSGIAQNVSLLSPQEKRIAEFVAKGLTNKEIARQCSSSPETIKKHLQKMFEKLGINRRSQLATMQADERLLIRKEQSPNKIKVA